MLLVALATLLTANIAWAQGDTTPKKRCKTRNRRSGPTTCPVAPKELESRSINSIWLSASTSRGAAAECSPGRKPGDHAPWDSKPALAGDRRLANSYNQVESMTRSLPLPVLYRVATE